MVRKIANALVAVSLVLVCCGGIPTDRSMIKAPGVGGLTIRDGQPTFMPGTGGLDWYMLGTRIKRDGVGYLAHRGEGEPAGAVYFSASQNDECGWEYDQEGIEQPGKRHWSAPALRLTRLKVLDGPFKGYYLGLGEEVPLNFKTRSPSGVDIRLTYRRAVLVREREKAPILEVQQYFIHK